MAFWDMNSVSSNATALFTENETFSYGRLASLADEIAEAARPGGVVLFVASNSAASIAGYLGLLRAGAVPLMVSGQAPPDTVEELDAAYLPEFAWGPVGSPVLSGGKVVCHLDDYVLVRLRAFQGDLHPDLALLLPTSGSTGSPRYVRASRENLQSNAESIASYMALAPEDTALTTLPFSYSYGISIVNSHFQAGGSLAVTDRSLMERGLWDMLSEARVTNFGGVPYTYKMLERLRFARMEFPTLRFVTQAGGGLGERLHESFARACAAKNVGFMVMYGQTEATARMSYLPLERALDKIGSIGIAIPRGTLRLEREDGTVIASSGEVGELVYEGPNVTMGYATCRGDLALGDELGGVLHTGDTARFDEEGFYYIEGRKNRFLKVFGNRVGLDDLERALTAHGLSAACAGEDDRVDVYVEENGEQKAKAILPALTGLSASAFNVVAIEKLPRSESGKVLYARLREDR